MVSVIEAYKKRQASNLAQTAEYEKLCAEWDKVQKMFGDEFIDRLFELEGEKEGWRAFHYYREGFRLGVRLMLEALGV